MQRVLTILASLALLALLTGCFATQYRITTTTGQTYIADDAPQYSVDRGTYTFTDEHGNTVVLNKDDIHAIKEE